MRTIASSPSLCLVPTDVVDLPIAPLPRLLQLLLDALDQVQVFGVAVWRVRGAFDSTMVLYAAY